VTKGSQELMAPDNIRHARACAAGIVLALALPAACALAAGESDALRDSGLRPSLSSGQAVAQTGDRLPAAAGSTGYVSTGELSGHPKTKRATKKQPVKAANPSLEPPVALPGQKMNPRIGALTPPPLHRKPIDQDPFGPVGFHAGAFLVKPSVEIQGGYDSNPYRAPSGPGSAFTELRGQLSAKSEWSRHEMQLDLRGSYIAYSGVDHLDRPSADAALRGKVDISRDLRLEYTGHAQLSTLMPGLPGSVSGARQLPYVYTLSTGAGLVKQFNRLEVGLYGEMSRNIYQDADLVSGGTLDLSDYNYNDYTVRLRGSYEVTPGLKPFVEVAADTRRFDTALNSYGIEQGSDGYKAEAGVEFDRPDLIKGRFGLGYITRSYVDPTLPNISGLLIDSSLIWKPSALTQVKLDLNSTINESVTTGAAGIFTREGRVTVDHWFRRWLVGSLFASYATDQYRGTTRVDDRWTYGAALTYSINRMLALRGELRHEELSSNTPGVDYKAYVAMLGLRLQR
jgi:hypothetical protein